MHTQSTELTGYLSRTLHGSAQTQLDSLYRCFPTQFVEVGRMIMIFTNLCRQSKMT